VSPALSWAAILAGAAVLWWLGATLVAWLMRPGPEDPRAAQAKARHPSQLPKAERLCQCRAYAFCHAEPRWFDAAGVRHAPDLCQPLREVA
jgi:hypothetical protein